METTFTLQELTEVHQSSDKGDRKEWQVETLDSNEGRATIECTLVLKSELWTTLALVDCRFITSTASLTYGQVYRVTQLYSPSNIFENGTNSIEESISNWNFIYNGVN